MPARQTNTMKCEGIEGCERFLSPGKGRGVKATQHFQLGELLFACPAYSYVLTVNERGGYCEFCFMRYPDDGGACCVETSVEIQPGVLKPCLYRCVSSEGKGCPSVGSASRPTTATWSAR